MQKGELKNEISNKNDISLPQIKNVSISLRSEQTEELDITRRKKNKNKQY